MELKVKMTASLAIFLSICGLFLLLISFSGLSVLPSKSQGPTYQVLTDLTFFNLKNGFFEIQNIAFLLTAIGILVGRFSVYRSIKLGWVAMGIGSITFLIGLTVNYIW